MTYLPWLKLSGSLPVYPSIINATTTRITWDFKKSKHQILALQAGWKINQLYHTPERKFYQFCRNQVNHEKFENLVFGFLFQNNTSFKISNTRLEENNLFCKEHELIPSGVKTKKEMNFIIGLI